MEKQKRAGVTKVTSVSIPFDLMSVIKEHNISPTLALKKGIGIELYMKGVPHYQSITNEERFAYMKRIDDAKEFEGDIEELQTALRKLVFDMDFIKEKFQKIKGGLKKEEKKDGNRTVTA